MQVRAQWNLLRLPSRSLSYAKIHNIFKSKPTYTKFPLKSKPTYAKFPLKSKAGLGNYPQNELYNPCYQYC